MIILKNKPRKSERLMIGIDGIMASKNNAFDSYELFDIKSDSVMGRGINKQSLFHYITKQKNII